uniref:NRT1/PTR family protein 2.3 n=1 Tax=Catharanthus roseus TaxID=4058 RepID=A0A1C8DRS4_CATRO|nr:NRT1/PTR family protein 2.3 [Catharanthus roseus]
MESKNEHQMGKSSPWFNICSTKCLPINSSSKVSSPTSSSSMHKNGYDEEKQDLVSVLEKQKKPGGWKAMPFVLGNETFERLANIGLMANFMMFLMTQFHMDQVSSSNVLSVWSACTSFLPLLGAFICDAYAGRFLTLSVATISAFLGMLTLTFIAWRHELHPPPCEFLIQPQTCKGPTASQMGVLILALTFLSIGSAGIRPCNIPFGVDQFDPNTEEGRKGINSFFNWYYTTFTLVLILALTVVVYIQDNVSWLLGFGIPAILMFCGIILFFLGTRVYVYVKPEGSVFSDIAEAISAAYKKRKLKLPILEEGDDVDGIFYNPPPKGRVIKKLSLTNQFRFLNKAALITEGEVNQDGSRVDKWRLSSIQSIEEVKCLLRIMPIWASGIICFTAIAQQGTFTMSQALKMDRQLGPHFQVPPGSMTVISLITVGIIVPIYDRIFVPLLRKKTKIEGGITLLQRIGIGFIFSILSMIVAGFIERKRRASALDRGSPDGIAPISVFWLSPQLILMGLCEAFNIIGQIEFYNKEFPDNMLSVANSLFSITMAGANYISIIIVNVIHKTTGKKGHPDWLTKDINKGRIENFYFVLAALGVLNFIYFLMVAPGYKYKSRVRVDEEEDEETTSSYSVELKGIKG